MSKRYKITSLAGITVAFIATSVWYLGHTNIAVLEPRGLIGHRELHLLIITLLLSLIVVVPLFSMLAYISWHYRESNHHARYSPDFDHSRIAETIWWLIPSLIIGLLSVIIWNSTHELDPYRALASSNKQLNIQVVALDWKWLFIYPKQSIASVNYFQMPVNTPVDFNITADAPMNSFWIPQLGGQIYAMPGMATQLHLIADQPGSYNGSSANISGKGFAGMTFVAHVDSSDSFNKWVNSLQHSLADLNISSYKKLAEPSSNNPVSGFALTQPDLYYRIIMKYMMPGMQNMNESSATVATMINQGMSMP